MTTHIKRYLHYFVLATVIWLASCGKNGNREPPAATVTATVTLNNLPAVPSMPTSAMPTGTLDARAGGQTAGPTSSSVDPTVTPGASQGTTEPGEGTAFYLDGGQFPPEIWRLDLRTLERTRIFYDNTPGFEVGTITRSPDKALLALSFSFYDPVSLQVVNRSGIQIMRTDGSESRVLVETTEPDRVITAPGWSPDSAQIAYIREYWTPGGYPPLVQIHLLDLDTGYDREITDEGGVFRWSPNGDRIAYAGQNNHGVYLFDLQSEEQVALWEDETLTFGEPAWRADGERIAVPVRVGEVPPSSSPEAGLYIIEVKSRERHKLRDGDFYGVLWSPDGRKIVCLAFALRMNRLWLIDVESGAAEKVLDTTARLGTPTWSSSGHALLLAIEEKLEQSYWISVLNVPERRVTRLTLANTMNPYSTW